MNGLPLSLSVERGDSLESPFRPLQQSNQILVHYVKPAEQVRFATLILFAASLGRRISSAMQKQKQ